MAVCNLWDPYWIQWDLNLLGSVGLDSMNHIRFREFLSLSEPYKYCVFLGRDLIESILCKKSPEHWKGYFTLY
jgi:hypothetical protein